MDAEYCEREVERAFAIAGLDPLRPPGIGTFARLLWGARAIRFASPPDLAGHEGLAQRRAGRWEILVRRDATDLHWTIAHECAEILLASHRQTPEIEYLAGRIAAALLIPRPLVLRCGDVARLSATLGLSPAVTIGRVAAVRRLPRVVRMAGATLELDGGSAGPGVRTLSVVRRGSLVLEVQALV